MNKGLLSAVLLLAACSGANESDLCLHEWVMDANEDTLKSEATCQSGSVYYKSCSKCGKLGETFVYGDTVPHVYASVNADKYLKSPATCSSRATYYKSCRNCGEAGTETFESLATLEHSWIKIANTETFYIAPTCTKGSVYRYTCSECGALSEDDKLFTLGPSIPHNDSHGDFICDTCDKPLKEWDDVPTDIVTDIHIFGKKED